MKDKYEVPVIEVIRFLSEDIITISGVTIDPNPDVPDTGVDPGGRRNIVKKLIL